MQVANGSILSETEVTGTNTYYSSEIDMSYLTLYWVLATFTGTPTGTFTIQESGDRVTWVDTSVTAAASGAAGSKVLTNGATYCCAKWLRVKYVNTSGAGNIALYQVTKG